jgi:hypothetical protein
MVNKKFKIYLGMGSGFTKMKGRNFREYGVFFQDFDSKEDYSIIKEVLNDLRWRFHNFFIIDSGRGLWVISLDMWKLKDRLLLKEELSHLKGFDWMHWAWELRRGFTIIRISKKKRSNKMKLLYWIMGFNEQSKPHYEIIKKICSDIPMTKTFYDYGIRIELYKSKG